MEKVLKEILSQYTAEDITIVHDTINELCSNGIAKGCYQDYGVLCDVLKLLTAFECEISKIPKER